MINYYTDMYAQRAHILRSLTSMDWSKFKWIWQEEQHAAFYEITQVMARETMLSFPDYTSNFDVYTNTFDYQIGGVIM